MILGFFMLMTVMSIVTQTFDELFPQILVWMANELFKFIILGTPVTFGGLFLSVLMFIIGSLLRIKLSN